MEQQDQTSAIEVNGQLMTREQYEGQVRQRIEAIHQFFVGMRDRWVQHRHALGVEARWRRANNLYHGDIEDSLTGSFERTLRDGPTARVNKQAPRSRVVINIVRPKVDQAVARMCEILFPVDDQNWGIKPTPVPEVKQRVGNQAPTVDPDTGMPTGATADSEAQAVIEGAKKKAEAMQREIADNLTECSYNGESRKLIEDGVRLGTGIIKGPYPRNAGSKKWAGGTLTVVNKLVPSSRRVDPWNVFFDPACGNDHQRGRGVYEKNPVTRKELRRLLEVPGFDAEAIRQVLREPPKRIRTVEGRVTKEFANDDSYEMWEYHGEVEAEDISMLTSQMGDPVTDVEDAVIVMVNDRIIGVLESFSPDGSLPYDVWCWRKADDSPYGYGLCDELENQQSVITTAWRMVMDNGRVGMGGQVVMKKGKVVPVNGSYDWEPMKFWYATDDLEDVNKAFGVFEVNSHLEELLAVAKAAMEFADVESNMPQILGGNQQGSTPETLGGSIMAFNNASAVLRRRVKAYDDDITRPHIGRYYDWHMLNNDNDDIKGDCEVDARGSSALVERDIQNQALLNLASVTNNPRYVPHLRERDELKAILKAFRVNPEELMKTEDEVRQDAEQAAQNPPQDPRVIAAQTQLQIKQMDIQDKQEQRAFEAGRNAAEIDFRNRNLQYNAMREQSEAEQSAIEAQMDREIALIKVGGDQQLSREQLAAKQRLEMVKIADGRERFNAEAALRMRTGQGI